ncbi:HPP family protein [Roseibium sp. M-1]
MSSKDRHFLRSALVPALPWPRVPEVMVAMAGGASGIAACALVVWLMSVSGALHLFLIAPLGATAVLVFAVPNSPLAQPWSAIFGNTVAAVCGVAAVSFLPPALASVAPVAAVALAFAAMMICRALHPPGGAVALLIGLTPELTTDAGAVLVCLNTVVLTCVLVLTGLLFHRFSGRKYPFRTSLMENGAPPLQRLGLNEGKLAEVLSKLHQSANLGAVDLARLVTAVEAELIRPPYDGISCADAVSGDGITVAPDAPIGDVAHAFGKTELTVLPVLSQAGHLLGMIRQKDLLLLLANAGLQELQTARVTAREIMEVPAAIYEGSLPLGKALPLMIGSRLEIVPICENRKFLGFLTRTGLMEALTFSTAALEAA